MISLVISLALGGPRRGASQGSGESEPPLSIAPRLGPGG